MPKRKRAKGAFAHPNRGKLSKRYTSPISNVDQNVVHELDLRGHAKSPDELKSYLREQQYAKSNGKEVGESTASTSCNIKTDLFPRGCMQVLLDYMTDKKMRIQRFQNEYGNVYKYHLQNPDLKALVASQGKWLTHLQMTPSSLLEEESPRRPKLQGCGYRRTALHAISLQALEISLHYDVKQQLLDLTRRNSLQVEHLREIILWDVGSNTTREQLVTLVRKAKLLQRLLLHDIELEKEERRSNSCGDGCYGLEQFLSRIAKDAGNKTLKVDVTQRKS